VQLFEQLQQWLNITVVGINPDTVGRLAYGASAVVMLVPGFLWVGVIAKSIYRDNIRHLMAASTVLFGRRACAGHRIILRGAYQVRSRKVAPRDQDHQH